MALKMFIDASRFDDEFFFLLTTQYNWRIYNRKNKNDKTTQKKKEIYIPIRLLVFFSFVSEGENFIVLKTLITSCFIRKTDPT